MIDAGVGDLVQRIRDDQAQVGCLVAGGLGGWVTPCVIRIVYVEETKSTGFRFSLKTSGGGLSVLWPQNHYDSFLVWTIKPRLTVW
jgi:hypothetical protein